MTINFESGTGNSADYDSEQKILTVTVDDSGPQTATAIATAIDGHTVDGSAATALFSATGIAAGHIDIGDGVACLESRSSF